MFPTADQIAIAVVAACRLNNEDPIRVVTNTRGSRARLVAMAALMEVFPKARRTGLGQCLRFNTPRAGQAAVITGRKQKWWRDEWVDEVVGSLVCDEFDDEEDEDRPSEPEVEPASNPIPDPVPAAGPAPIHFDAVERRLISRMWHGGASPVSIGAAIGADGDVIRMYAQANPHICPPRGAA